MKILFVLPEYYPHYGGGISTYYLELIPALKPFVNQIKVLVGSGYTQSDEAFVHKGIIVEYLKPALFQKYLPKFSKFCVFPEVQKNVAAAWAMWEQVQNEKFDVVECTDFGLGFIPWLINPNQPVVIKMHGSTGQISSYDYKPQEQLAADFVRQTELLFFKKSHLLQTYSKANQVFWQKQFPEKKVSLLDPVYAEIKKPVPYNNRTNYGLVTGRIQEWKGPKVLCEAASILKESMPEVHWYGRDMPYENLGTSMRQYLLKNYPDSWNKTIIPRLPIPNIEIKGLQANAKFGLIASTWDMFNFTCVEFMAAGTLTICADGAGASALIENGINGFTYPAQDTNALAELLKEVSSLTLNKIEQIANYGQETVAKHLSAEALIPSYVACYHNAIKNFVPEVENKFIKTIYLPSERIHTLDELLDSQPLRLLINYNLKRLKNKFF